MADCVHTVGIYYDQSDTDLVVESDLTTDIEDRDYAMHVGDVVFFECCPNCGEKLDLKERYAHTVEIIENPLNKN